MLKPDNPAVLAEEILKRSICAVQVGAVLTDEHGIYSWGWNSAGGTGLGEHAEMACLRRANRRRLKNSIMFVAARRRKSGNVLLAKPCEACQKRLKAVRTVLYRDKGGWWQV